MLSKNQIKQIQFLHLKKHRDKEKLFIAEGIKLCIELIKLRPQSIKHIFCTSHFSQNNKTILNDFSKLVFEVSEEELKKISLQENPNEVLIIASFLDFDKKVIDFDSEYSLFLDDIRDPGNMGTIIRLADWYGIKQIFASTNTCDIYNPKVIQSSMGAILRVQVVYDSLQNIMNTQSIKNIYGALLNGNSLYNTSLKPGLIVIGNEANGIDKQNINLVNHPITIPSSPKNGTESLNAGVAAAIIVSEFYRQLSL